VFLPRLTPAHHVVPFDQVARNQLAQRCGRGCPPILNPVSRWHDPSCDGPMEFLKRLAARVPCPRLHLILFHGVLASNVVPDRFR